MNLLQKQTTFSGYIGWNKLEYLSKTDKMSHVIQLQTLIFVLYWIEAGIFYTDLCVAELELHNLYLRRICLFQRKVCETNHGAKQMKELSGMSHFSPEQFDFGTLGFQITAYLWQWQNRRKKKTICYDSVRCPTTPLRLPNGQTLWSLLPILHWYYHSIIPVWVSFRDVGSKLQQQQQNTQPSNDNNHDRYDNRLLSSQTRTVVLYTHHTTHKR